MLIEFDENLGERGRRLFADAGHDVATVGDQELAGAADRTVIEVCQTEWRCLVTLARDFSNPFVLPPEPFAGIAVLRLPHRLTPPDLYATVESLIVALGSSSIEGKLWIVERHRTREYLPDGGGPEP